MSMLIPGPKSHGMDIEVYLRPLILELKELWENSVSICQLEMLFPPSFFNIMMQLLVHLPEEAKLGGPFFIDGCIQRNDM